MHEMIDARRGRLGLSQSPSPSQSQSFQSSSPSTPRTSTRHSRSNELLTIHEEPEPESEIPRGRDDLFTNLLDANEAYASIAHANDSQTSKRIQEQERESLGYSVTKLRDEELIGNVFMFLLAGHEVRARLSMRPSMTYLVNGIYYGVYTYIRDDHVGFVPPGAGKVV